MRALAVLLGCAVLLSGCVIGHQEFVRYQAPVRYPPAEGTWVFEYSNVDLRQLKDALFPEFLTLAESSFVGPYEDPMISQRYATEMGADVFIVSTQFKETRTSIVPLTLPTTSTTTFTGSVGAQGFSGSATTYGTSTTMIPVSVDRYRQTGMYLRNVRNVKPLWRKTSADFIPSVAGPYDGTWRDEHYRVSVYRSGEQVVGVIREVLDRSLTTRWSPDDVKFILGAESQVGIYLNASRAPMPVRASVNAFGFLEFEIVLNGQKFSFVKE